VTGTVTRTGTARFESLDSVVRIEVESTPLRDRISDEVFERIRADAVTELADFGTRQGHA
jgi:hypothetical protein